MDQWAQSFSTHPHFILIGRIHPDAPVHQGVSPRWGIFVTIQYAFIFLSVFCFVQAVYFYQPDGRGPCLAFEGEKLQLHWFRGYLIIVSKAVSYTHLTLPTKLSV